MRKERLRERLRQPSGAAATLAVVLILAGALIWFGPYLTRKEPFLAATPAPAALLPPSEFPLAPQQQACMSSVTINPNSRVAQFGLRPAKTTPRGGPPVELVMSGSGYRAVAIVPAGYLGGDLGLPITPPKHALIGSACFTNRGTTTVLLIGSVEARTISRSETIIGGKSVVGDITLTFADDHRRSLTERLGEVFGHASNLTDRLVPVWLIWMLAVLVAFGVPIAMVAAFYRALREDEATAQHSH